MISHVNGTHRVPHISHAQRQAVSKGSNGTKSLMDYVVNVSSERLSFYNDNKGNGDTLLDAVNFFHGAVGGGSNGYFTFGNDGHGQMIPVSAVPRINVDTKPPLMAKGNKLCLNSNSYYAFKGSDGKKYACAFNGEVIQRAYSEFVLGNDMKNVSAECRGNMATTMRVISNLVKGTVGAFHMMDRAAVKKALASVGITPGKFTISVDGVEKTYYLAEDGEIFTDKRAKEMVAQYNKNDWLKSGKRAPGDKIMVFGREYPIGEDGHIHVPADDFWTSRECRF